MRLTGAAALAVVPVLAFSVVSVATPANAQDRVQPDDDPEMEVVRVTGIRTGRFLDAPSASVTHIDLESVRAEGKTIDELLGEQAGVQVRRFGGAGEPATLSIRGSSAAQVDVTLNGVSINSPLTGGVDVSELCIGNVDGASLTRGGRDAIGGRVDLSSPLSTGERQIMAGGSFGSFGTWRGETHFSDTLGVDDAKPTTTGVDLALGYCGFKTDGDYTFQRPVQDNGDQVIEPEPASAKRVNNDRQKHAGHVGFGLPIGERHRIELRDYVAWKKGGVPGLDSAIDTSPFAGQDRNARGEQLTNVAILDWRSAEVGWLGDEAALGVYHHYQSDDYDNPAEPASVEPDVSIETHMHRGGVRSLQRWVRDAFGGVHELGVRFDASRDAVYSDAALTGDRARTNVEGDATVSSTFFGDLLTVAPGLRVAWTQGFDPAWLPSLGVVVQPLDWLRLRGNVYRSWRPPSFDELYHPDRGFIRGNPDLSAERSMGVDGGLDLIFDAVGPLERLRFTVGGFYDERDDEIVWTQVSPWVVAPVNLSDTRYVGLELSVTGEITRWVGFAASHTELDATLSSTDRPPPGRAERQSFARLRIGPDDVWKLVGEWHYTGEIGASLGGRVILPARHVGNVTASLDVARVVPRVFDRVVDSLWTYVAVDNVGDVTARDALFAPQPGRSLTIGLEARW